MTKTAAQQAAIGIIMVFVGLCYLYGWPVATTAMGGLLFIEAVLEPFTTIRAGKEPK